MDFCQIFINIHGQGVKILHYTMYKGKLHACKIQSQIIPRFLRCSFCVRLTAPRSATYESYVNKKRHVWIHVKSVMDNLQTLNLKVQFDYLHGLRSNWPFSTNLAICDHFREQSVPFKDKKVFIWELSKSGSFLCANSRNVRLLSGIGAQLASVSLHSYLILTNQNA